jgi:hypothetical protein
MLAAVRPAQPPSLLRINNRRVDAYAVPGV